jgi:hypothetical protein
LVYKGKLLAACEHHEHAVTNPIAAAFLSDGTTVKPGWWAWPGHPAFLYHPGSLDIVEFTFFVTVFTCSGVMVDVAGVFIIVFLVNDSMIALFGVLGCWLPHRCPQRNCQHRPRSWQKYVHILKRRRQLDYHLVHRCHHRTELRALDGLQVSVPSVV